MELTPKQQAVELIKQAQKILLVTGREPNNDQFAAIIVLQSVLSKLGKEAITVISDELPKAKNFLDSSKIAKDITGIQDFIISLNLDKVEIDKLKYHVENGKLNISVTPKKGNFTKEDANFSYGDYNFDLVIAVGVAKLEKMDRVYEQNPTIFDDLHLINIDYHRINENYGSVNWIDYASGSVCEILVSLVESLGQDLMDENIATALLTGIIASTNRFTADNTTPKALSIAAQMLAAKANRAEIVRALYENGQKNNYFKKSSQSLKKPEYIKPPAIVEKPTRSPGPFKGKIEGSKKENPVEKTDTTSKNK